MDQPSQVQKAALQQWVRDGRLKTAFGGDERLARIREVLETRLRSGDFVCVLSSGFASVIKLALQHVGLSDLLPQDLIFGCDTGPYGISRILLICEGNRAHSLGKCSGFVG